MTQKVLKVGKSTAVTIPKEILVEMRLKAGDEVLVDFDKKKRFVIIRPDQRTSARQERIAELTHNFIERYRKDLEELAKK